MSFSENKLENVIIGFVSIKTYENNRVFGLTDYVFDFMNFKFPF